MVQPPEAVLEVFRRAMFWFVRVRHFLSSANSYDHPLQLRLMELASHFIFALCGIQRIGSEKDATNALHEALTQSTGKSVATPAIKASPFRRWMWHVFHKFIEIKPRFEPELQVRSRDVKISDTCSVRIFTPNAMRVHEILQSASQIPTVLFFHGGGFALNSVSTATHHVFCERLAGKGFLVVSVEYRLAPEAKFPAAIQDCLAALLWVKSKQAQRYLPNYVNQRELIVAGDSAGGNLCAVVSSLVRDKLDANLKPTLAYDGCKIVHQVVIYGTFFCHPLVPSMRQLAEEKRVFSFLSRDAVHCFAAYYAPGDDARQLAKDRRCAPMLAGTHFLPRTTVFTADDPLKDENIMYVESLRASGVQVNHYHYDSCHGYLTFEFLKTSGHALADLLDDLAYITHSPI